MQKHFRSPYIAYPESRKLSWYCAEMAAVLCVSLALTFHTLLASAHPADCAVQSAQASLRPALMVSSRWALEAVKFLPQHNSRPAPPPPNRPSYTKQPPHHA